MNTTKTMLMLMRTRSAVSSVCCLLNDEFDDDDDEYEYDDGDANIVLVDVYNNSNSIRCANTGGAGGQLLQKSEREDSQHGGRVHEKGVPRDTKDCRH